MLTASCLAHHLNQRCSILNYTSLLNPFLEFCTRLFSFLKEKATVDSSDINKRLKIYTYRHKKTKVSTSHTLHNLPTSLLLHPLALELSAQCTL